MQVTLDLQRFFDFVLVLARTATVVAVMPVLGGRWVPAQVKVLVSLTLAVVLTAAAPPSPAGVEAGGMLVLLAVREVVIGLALGFVASFIFDAVEYAGELAGMQMGFSIAGVFDPQHGAQSPVLSTFQRTLLAMLFIGIGGHWLVIRALAESLRVAPVGTLGLGPAAPMAVVQLAGRVFVIAAQVAAPATAMLLLVNIALAVVARVVPQMNVFIVGFPLMITVGMGVIVLALPAFAGFARHLVEGMARDLGVLLGGF